LAMSDELVDFELAVQVVIDETAHLRTSLDTAESTPFPHASGDELEC
jgi:hypothetical protein